MSSRSARELSPSAGLIPLDGPLDVSASLQFLRRSGDDMIDRWDGSTLVRTMPAEGRSLAYACSFSGTRRQPVVTVSVEAAEARRLAEQVAREIFVTAPPDFSRLLTEDPVIARLNQAFPGLRPVRQLDLFSAVVRCISAQQVNLRWAAITRRRLAEAFGHRHEIDGHTIYSLAPARLAGLTVAQIKDLQFTTRKAEYIIGAAEAVAGGQLDLATLAALPDEEVITALTAVRGLGVWTAEWILVRTLGRGRVVAGDLAVRKAVGAAYLDGALPSEAEVRQMTAHWGPSAGIAQGLLLQSLAT